MIVIFHLKQRLARLLIASWEKLSIYLTFLIPKLPAPKEEDLSKR